LVAIAFSFRIFVPVKIFKKITAVFLASVFLLSSMSFTISSMVCLKSGKGKVSLSLIEDCCKKKNEEKCCDEINDRSSDKTYIGKGDCCAISNLSIQLHDFNPSKKIAVEQPVLENILFFSPVPFSSFSSSQKLPYQLADLPPPYHGRALLNFISTFRI
jgi:hypothetical protein